ncbi:hypothetical protein IWW39_004662 [Coemansia spiralis]|uniref:Thioesterase domain-containing protein n=1 Tax=Coemansia spiralis TaxID=417178 RepID=A0A9W8GJ13_9FUNG|nr:hypothetical protein IWW39_004662 [Coemansia spiralis]
MFKRFVSLNLCPSTRQFARAYTIPRSTAQRIALKGSTKQPTESKMISIGTSYVFSPAMLATWAACCMAFGVSISLFGVDQGWINFVGGNKPNKSELLSQDSEDEDTLSVDEEYAAITARLMSTEAAKECLENTQEWKRLPYFWNTRDKSYESAFIPSTLHAPDKMSVEPVVFLNRDRQQFVFIIHIGKRLCGHDGIVHGGVQATLFDEVTARPAFWNLPRNVALTASLKVNYRRPVVADQILVFKSQLSKLEGRKAIVTAQLEDLSGNLLSDAEALYVSPGNEKLFPDNSSRIKAFEDTYPGSF